MYMVFKVTDCGSVPYKCLDEPALRSVVVSNFKEFQRIPDVPFYSEFAVASHA